MAFSRDDPAREGYLFPPQVFERVVVGKSVFLFVKRPKRASRRIYGFEKVEKIYWSVGFFSYFKDSAIYSSSKGCNVLNYVCERGTFLSKMAFK